MLVNLQDAVRLLFIFIFIEVIVLELVLILVLVPYQYQIPNIEATPKPVGSDPDTGYIW
jgi:hypothetical protein